MGSNAHVKQAGMAKTARTTSMTVQRSAVQITELAAMGSTHTLAAATKVGVV
jgi:hypothetical protein